MADLNHKAFNIAFGSVGAGFGTLVDMSAVAAAKTGIKRLQIYNTTDAGITISFDNATDHYSIPAAKDFFMEWANLGKIGPKIVYVKRLSGAPTSGAVTGGASS